MAYVAYRGLNSWPLIGIGWLLHTAWDMAHHIKGNPILPFFHDSSLGCAICDPVIALWCFGGGPSLIASVAGAAPAGKQTTRTITPLPPPDRPRAFMMQAARGMVR